MMAGHELRCIVYLSRAVAPWSQADLAALGLAANARNGPFGITGRLVHSAGTFVQTLEGPTSKLPNFSGPSLPLSAAMA